jgi:polyisoprenoid-binding protein YceI
MRRLACAAFVLTALVAAPGGAERFTAAPGSEVKISGTSTMHDWTMTGTRLDGEVGIDPEAAAVSIPIESIKSEHERMDRLMREALDAKAHPAVTFRLAAATLTPAEAGAKFTVRATGELTIKGRTKEVALDVAVERPADGGLVITGEAPILMTDYGVKPPVAMLGEVKTGDRVVVSFRWVLAPASAAP